MKCFFISLFLVISFTSLFCQRPFITTWQTGPSNEKIIIPILPSLDYEYNIDWENDGIIDEFGVTKAAEHAYASAGIYQIAITGVFPSLYINDASEKEKIVSIDQWGDIQWATMVSAFDGAENLLYKATDTPDLSQVKFLTYMFRNAALLDADISYWDISGVLDMAEMLDGTAMSTTNYDKLLYRWSRQQIQESVILGAQTVSYCVSEESKENLESQGWNINDEGQSCSGNRPFIMTWRTISANEDIFINTEENVYAYNYDVDWENDGTIDQTNVSGDLLHTYPQAGDHQVAIYGTFPTIKYGDVVGYKYKLINIDQWGDLEWQSMANSFDGCTNLNSDAYDVPDLTGVKSLSGTFVLGISFNGDLSQWDVSSVTDMSSLFGGARLFNQDLGAWKMDSVKNIHSMFGGARSFNQDIHAWNVSNVTDMSSAFRGARDFNQDISSWDVANVTNMSNMFNYAETFDKPIDTWDVTNVTEMEAMFERASSFNQALDSWDVDSVTTMREMFYKAESFNQNISSWNVSNVTNMEEMFAEAVAFNQNINSWDVRNVEDMDGMFYSSSSFNQPLSNWKLEKIESLYRFLGGATSFNQNLSSWDVSNVTNMVEMFSGTTAFNQDISGWDVSSVTSFGSMFEGAISFDQDLGDWDISGERDMNSMLDGAGMSQFNYDSTLIKWSNQLVFSDVELGAQGLIYCNGSDARNTLVSDNDWDITGDIESCINAQPCVTSQENRYLGPTSGSWNIDAHWSLGRVPSVCDDVVIPSGFIITLEDNAACYTLEISVGSVVEFEDYNVLVWGL